MPNIPTPKVPKVLRPLFMTIMSVVLMLLALAVTALLLIATFSGTFVIGVSITALALGTILVVGGLAIILTIATAIGMLLMKRWAFWTLLVVFLLTLIVPVREIIGGDFVYSSLIAPVLLGLLLFYLYRAKTMMR